MGAVSLTWKRAIPPAGFADYYPAWVDRLAVQGPHGCFHLVTSGADGQTQHIAARSRPLSSLRFFSRLLRERFAGTPYAERFHAARPEPP